MLIIIACARCPIKSFNSTQSYYTGQSQKETDNSAMALQVSVQDQQTGKLILYFIKINVFL